MLNRKNAVRIAGVMLVAGALAFAPGALSAQATSTVVTGFMDENNVLYQFQQPRYHGTTGTIKFNMTRPIPCGGTTTLGLRATAPGGAQISNSLTWGGLGGSKTFVKSSTGSTSFPPTWTYFNGRMIGAGCAEEDYYFTGTYTY